ncbi:unnamed protein product, partial [Iphiclides podalirius]
MINVLHKVAEMIERIADGLTIGGDRRWPAFMDHGTLVANRSVPSPAVQDGCGQLVSIVARLTSAWLGQMAIVPPVPRASARVGAARPLATAAEVLA